MKKRPGGRSARTRAAVAEAASALLSERGPSGISMAEIAQRAGVAVTSLYRRWGSVDALLLDVAVDRLRGMKPLPDTGSLEGDLETWGNRIASSLRNPERTSIFRVLVASAARMDSNGTERHKALAPRIAQMAEMLDRAKQRGESAPSISDVVDYLMAPLYTRALFGMEIDDGCVSRLVRRLMDDKH